MLSSTVFLRFRCSYLRKLKKSMLVPSLASNLKTEEKLQTLPTRDVPAKAHPIFASPSCSLGGEGARAAGGKGREKNEMKMRNSKKSCKRDAKNQYYRCQYSVCCYDIDYRRDLRAKVQRASSVSFVKMQTQQTATKKSHAPPRSAPVTCLIVYVCSTTSNSR
jgi:hypothetical protein